LQRRARAHGERGVGDAAHAIEPLAHRLGPWVTGQVEHDAPGKLMHGSWAEIAHRPREILLEVAEKERPVAALEADLVVVDDDAGPETVLAHASGSGARGCLGRRREGVFGTSPLGGLRGMGLRTVV